MILQALVHRHADHRLKLLYLSNDLSLSMRSNYEMNCLVSTIKFKIFFHFNVCHKDELYFLV